MQHIYILVLLLIAAAGAVWLTFSLRRIIKCREDMARADKQLVIYRLLRANLLNAQEAALRQEQVEISEEIYNNTIYAYNHCIKKPQNRFSAWLIGCKAVSKK